MNLFEQELGNILNGMFKESTIHDKTFVGKIDDTLRAKVYWYDSGTKDNYDALVLKIINRVEGEVDRTVIRLGDVWGKKEVRPGFVVSPHIWVDRETDWYGYRPSLEDRMEVRKIIKNYVDVYR